MAHLRLRVIAGILAAAVILGVAELLAAFFGADTAPLNALGATVVDHTPDALREWAISTFGTSDKAVLYLIMGVVAVVVAGLAGALERTAVFAGSAMLGVFGLVAAVVVIGRGGVIAVVPTVIGVGAGIYALRALTRRIDDLPEPARSSEIFSDTGTSDLADTSDETDTGEPATGVSGAEMTAELPNTDPAAALPADDTKKLPNTADSPRVAPTGESQHDVDKAPAPVAKDSNRANAPSTSGGTRDPSTTARTENDSASTLPARRQVLRGMAIAGGVAAVAGIGGKLFGSLRTDVSGERAAVRLPQPIAPPEPILEGSELRLPGLTPFLTPNDEFYRIDTALVVPQVSKDSWSLRIHGMVDREIVLTWDDLANRAAVERLVTLACVSNEVGGDLIGNARWLGYRLDELLAEAGPHPDADMVLSRSTDGWTAGTPLSALTDGRDAILAVGMNGEPLPVQHGYPARLVVPGLYGYVSATKWVTELEVTRYDRATAYWTRRGWSAQGPIKTGTRIDTPRPRRRIDKGHTMIAGITWAQHRGISGVEVQIDNAAWQPARLADEQSIDTWRQWVYEWDATPGQHTIRARATDGTGETQTATRADVIPDGASGYPSVLVQVG
ncbi:molybdopterin-dependent oxidoreductase [Nocardia callitridis]|uniref:Oxidoreductase molybdopterin-binding domain-containing protein n=1 Tax=Nocardia callitridis TaxID=648753 RepID=A0ABP9JTL1_9NOCA